MIMESDLQVDAQSLPGGGIVLRLGGALDGGGAYQLRDRITSICDPARRVVVDFTRVSRLSDFGLGILAMGISGLPEHGVELVGLGHHAQRILKAFGLPGQA